MINSKTDLKNYLHADAMMYGRKTLYPHLIFDYHWKFLYALRHEEYHANQKGGYHKIMKKIWHLLHYYYGVKMGWDIPINVFGPGLKINHFGCIIVNEHAKVGAFCDIHQGVNIGQQGKKEDDVPTIGNNVWIGPGAKIFGKITIADKCAIGANSVVNKNFKEENITIAGIPAKKISDNGNPYLRNFQQFTNK